jgi:hypothetical protein
MWQPWQLMLSFLFVVSAVKPFVVGGLFYKGVSGKVPLKVNGIGNQGVASCAKSCIADMPSKNRVMPTKLCIGGAKANL